MANAQAATDASGWEFDFFRLAWRLLTSVRFALILIGLLASSALLGVLIPQIPVPMRGNPAAIDAWVEFQRGKFGFFTDFMYGVGLFNVFHSLWFGALLGVLVASVCVCTANRLPSVWRNVRQPQTRVPDDYFTVGTSRPLPPAAARGLVAALKRRRYRVTTEIGDGATYLFADRFPWAQLATFVSHLALILFLAGGLVTVTSAKQSQILIAEGTSEPVFGLTDASQMQVYVEDAVGKFDTSGFPLDYRTSLVVYKNGQEVARGVSTVNDPLRYAGYKFHQSAYFPDGAALRIRDLGTGRVVYSEVLTLEDSASAPRIVVRDADQNVVLSDIIVPTDFLQDTAGTTIHVPGSDRDFWVGARAPAGSDAWQLVVFETSDPSGVRTVLDADQTTDLGDGLALTFVGVTGLPSTLVTGLPGATSQQQAIAMATTAEGKTLTVGPIDGRAVTLAANAPVQIGGYEYDFLGSREFAGITVRRDPGGTFIWVATGLLLLGLVLTFYLPRRRLWGKIANGSVSFRGLGGRSTAIEKEIEQVVARANAGVGGQEGK